jgi:hypothetical protein
MGRIIDIFPEFLQGLDLDYPSTDKPEDSFDGRGTLRYQIASGIYRNREVFFLSLLLQEKSEAPTEETVQYGLGECLKNGFGSRMRLLKRMCGTKSSDETVQDAYYSHLSSINHRGCANSVQQMIRFVRETTGSKISEATAQRVYAQKLQYRPCAEDLDFIEQETGFALPKETVKDAFLKYVEERWFDTLGMLIERTDPQISNNMVQYAYEQIVGSSGSRELNSDIMRLRALITTGPSEATIQKVYIQHAKEGRLDRLRELQQATRITLSPTVLGEIRVYAS